MKISLYAHGGSANHGCEAIARSTIQVLGRENDYTIMSEQPLEDETYGLGDIATIRRTRTNIPQGGIQGLIYRLKAKIGNGDAVYYKYLYKDMLNETQETDLALAIGGDNYCYNGFLERFSVQNNQWRRQHVPCALWGCSIDPERITPSMVRDLKSYAFITARESITYEALKAHHLQNVFKVPDTAFLLDKIEEELPAGFQEKNTVGINISPLITGKEQEKGIVRRNIERLIEHILQATSMSVALIPHVVWRGNDDRVPLSEIYDKYKSNPRVVMIEDANAMTLKGFISRCRFMIAARTHASIASYSTEIPTLVIGYSVKSRGIAQDLFGTDENYVIPIQSITTDNIMTESFFWLQSQEENICARLKSILPSYKSAIVTGAKCHTYGC